MGSILQHHTDSWSVFSLKLSAAWCGKTCSCSEPYQSSTQPHPTNLRPNSYCDWEGSTKPYTLKVQETWQRNPGQCWPTLESLLPKQSDCFLAAELTMLPQNIALERIAGSIQVFFSLVSSLQPCFFLWCPICSGLVHVDVGQLLSVATGLHNYVL